MDLIERQAAIRIASGYCHPANIANELAKLPSAQPEIIRCKDNKHLFEDNKCPLRTWWTHTEDDFCSYAERKTDE